MKVVKMKISRRKKYCIYCGHKTYKFRENGKCIDCEHNIGFNNTIQKYGDLF